MGLEQFYLDEGFPFQGRKLDQLKKFLDESDLTYDEQIQYSVLLKTMDGEIAGCGSRHENTLKCIAVNKKFQGEGCLQIVMTQLLKNAFEQHISHLFLFTKPMYLHMFSDMGFYPIMETEDMLLMENRKNGITEYLQKEASACSPSEGNTVGCIVMNANPFTNGHKYLVKTAAKACDMLHIFVLSTDSSEFPADIRLKLVKKGCEHLPNVQVHGSSDYLISHATFPDYFLKDKASASDTAAVLDLMIFGKYFKEAFGITRRFVGEEPFSRVTRAYNEQMKKILPSYDIQVTEIPRCQTEETTISATFVRQKFLEGDFEILKDFVPETTYSFNFTGRNGTEKTITDYRSITMNHSIWTKGSSVTLMEILDAREKRAAIQQEMLKENPASLLSFTMNIAGPVKVFPLTKWLYSVGISIIQKGISFLDGTIMEFREVKENTGYECFFALSLPPESIKKYLMEQEEHHPLGRLFDFDVLRPDGTKVSRQELGFPERTCLICSSPAFICGRSRTHSAQELIAREIQMMEDFYLARMSVHIGLLMQKALLYEVNTTLKPGLVDRKHNGSHKDMCIDTFVKSAYALTPYFIQCAKAGLSFDKTSEELPELFHTLRELGKEAETAMLLATDGVNTHKGIVFSGGILCGAVGYAKSCHMSDFFFPEFLTMLSEICKYMLLKLLDDYSSLEENTAKTHGEKLYVKYGITGIRGEASLGFPHVLQHGLPLFKETLDTGCSLNQSGLISLLYYIAHTEDTNLIIRSDYETAKKIQTELSDFLDKTESKQQLSILPQLDNYFISKNISPGGSADMLALTYFLHFLQTLDCVFG